MDSCKSILLVEDSIEIQEVLKELLEQEGHTVSIAGTGGEAFRMLASSHEFSIVLLDNTLPDMMAMTLLEKLKTNFQSEQVPVILCSASSNLRQIKWPSQVVSILPKPFKIEELFSAVHKFSRTVTSPAPSLQTG